MLTKLNLSNKQTGFQWREEEFLIESEISENYLFLASLETIFQNGKKIFAHGGFKSKRSAVGEFRDREGELHKIELRCSKVVDSWISLTVLIDDSIVFKGGTPIKGVLTSIAIYTPILFALLLLLGRLLGLYFIHINF